MTLKEINQHLDELERQLLNEAEQIVMSVNTAWGNQFPNEAAVYIFREDDTIVHVGETKNLNALMVKLVSVKSVDDDMVDILLHDIIAKNLKLSYLLVGLGRKELEERVLKRLVLIRKPILKPKNNRRIKTLTNAGQQKMMKNWNCFFAKEKR